MVCAAIARCCTRASRTPSGIDSSGTLPRSVKSSVARGDPRISVDAKKKELVGNFKNAGQSWRQEAEEVNAHDFPQDAECRASQYGIYDPERNEGHVCVATSADTADLAVDAIVDWWRLRRPNYPQAKRLMIEADSGGSNACAVAAVQEEAAGLRRRKRAGDHGVPLSAGDVEVEPH